MVNRLNAQMEFLNEVEKLKVVYRRNRVADRTRYENSAEHSWHVALMALVLAEHADGASLDILKVLKMLLVHDLVEIDAGDTWAYDVGGQHSSRSVEQASAERIFSLLPTNQAIEFLLLWDEFNAQSSPEARFAASIDSLQPLSNHVISGEPSEQEARPTRDRVIARKRHIAESSKELWRIAQDLIDESVTKGLYVA